MYCPLCTAEYRDGFTTCNDCRVPLVGTVEEAASGRVRFWKGSSQAKLDRILEAFQNAGIPLHFKERPNLHVEFRVLGIRIGKKQPMIEYEVWIFRHDLERARKAAANITLAGVIAG
jgi:hypothetical protein